MQLGKLSLPDLIALNNAINIEILRRVWWIPALIVVGGLVVMVLGLLRKKARG